MSLRICVVTVSYGNRWSFLQRVMERVLGFSQVSDVVVVNNASEYSVSDVVAVFEDDRVHVLNEAENIGSAGGYADGIAYAKDSTSADLIWLLDDDNLPAENSAAVLLEAWGKLEGSDDQKALFCFREDRLTHQRIAKGQDPSNYYLVPDNFMGFHLFRMLKNKLRKAKNAQVDRQNIKPFAQMPYVPYGGFVLHRLMVDKIGFPNRDFFVYVDDSEYTHRVTAFGGAIWLVSSALITDIDPSQGNNYKAGFLRSPLLDLWNFRTYYQVRNRIYFYSRNSVRHPWIYLVNQFLFMLQLFLIALLSGKRKQFAGLRAAVKHGHEGVLGKRAAIPGT